MKWSELPQEYKDLEKGFNDNCFYSESDVILDRLRARHTPQGFKFWWLCQNAESVEQLPKILIHT